MGTRHLIGVVKDNQLKVAQYGQWDGYPEGQGAAVLEFLSNKENINKLTKNLSKTRFIDEDGVDKDFIESYRNNAPEWSNDPDNRTEEQVKWFKTYMSRDLGAEILFNIAESKDDEILIANSEEFARDSLFCEYAYIIDLDANQLEVYKGFNKNPVGNGRFLSKGDEGEYHPIVLVKKYQFNELPSADQMSIDVDPQDEY